MLSNKVGNHREATCHSKPASWHQEHHVQGTTLQCLGQGFGWVPTAPLGRTIPSLGYTSRSPALPYSQLLGKVSWHRPSLCRQVKQKQLVVFLQHKLFPPSSLQLPSSLSPPFCHRRFPAWTDEVPPQGSCPRLENQS